MADITLIPVIISAVLTPNPAQANSTVHVSIAAAELETVAQTEVRLSGEFYSGEI